MEQTEHSERIRYVPLHDREKSEVLTGTLICWKPQGWRGAQFGFQPGLRLLLFLPSSSACPGPSQVSQWIYIPAVCQHMCVYVFVWERVCVTKSCHCAPYSYHFTISCQEQHTVQCKTNSKHWRKLFIHVFKVLHNATTIGYGKEFPRTFLTLSRVNRMCSLPAYFSLTDSSIDQKQWS